MRTHLHREVTPARRRLLRAATVLALAAALLSFGATAVASACKHAGKRPSQLTLKEARHAIRCLVNKKRHRAGLRRLRGNSLLREAAQAHSTAMDSYDFFSHYSPDGGSPSSRVGGSGYAAGASRWNVGENIGWGSGGSGTPRAAVRGWMGSGVHRGVILTRGFRHIGVGFVPGSPDGAPSDSGIYTVDFGYRK